jgi:transposase
MAGWRQVVELAMTEEEIEKLMAVSRSRTEPASRVERAQMLLAYREDPSFFAAARRVGGHHQTVQRCVERALAYGPLVALDDRPRPGKEPTITPEAKAWVVSLACDKAKEHGYPHELWTTRLLARHAREHGPAAGHLCLAKLVQGTVCKILNREEIKPHKVRYYLECRDAEFEQKMAEVLSARGLQSKLRLTRLVWSPCARLPGKVRRVAACARRPVFRSPAFSARCAASCGLDADACPLSWGRCATERRVRFRRITGKLMLALRFTVLDPGADERDIRCWTRSPNAVLVRTASGPWPK